MDVLVAFVLGARPKVTETATGYVVTVPHGRRAFIISPGTEAPSLRGPGGRHTRAPRREGGGRDLVVSGHVGGRVSGRAWDSDALVQTLSQSRDVRS
jgi:hypothetical protein